MTTPLLFKEYIWLVNTIHDAGGITLKEINEKWTATEMSGGVELSRSVTGTVPCHVTSTSLSWTRM